MQPSKSFEQNHRILVVDDNRAIHEDIRKILVGDSTEPVDLASDEEMLFGELPAARAEFEIDSAYQGQEGLAMLEQSIAEGRPYALAFVDIRMPPGWDGVQTIERLWQACPNLQVVICTAYSDYSWTDISRRLGNSENLLILKKPFDNIEVIQLAYALTKKWSVSREAAARLEDLDQLVAQRTEEFKRAQAAFRAVFEASPIGISLSDMNARCVQVNQAFEQISGLSAGEIIGKNPLELGWVDSPETMGEIGQQLASFGCVDARELRFRHPANGERTGLLWLREVTINHSPNILSFFLDITDRKQMEEDLKRARAGAEAAARAKSEFLANMSHEIRTPLNGVLGLSSLLDEKDVPADAHSMVRLIRASGETLAKILDDVLDFSKIECGKLEIEQAPFSLRESLEWGVELFRAKALEKHLALDLHIDPRTPDALVGDATRLRQVLANLISNAIKFTELGGISIHAGPGSGPAPHGAHRISVRVSDTGIGIPPGKVDHLFKAFSQLDPSTNRRFGGSGLGLAICRRLVELMGGSIRARSRPDAGSEFEFDFVARAGANAPSLVFSQPDSNLARLRILLAEDNQINQLVVERMLAKLGCNAEIVADGTEAVQKATESQFDLVFLDVQMPGVDGIEAAKRIRATSARSADSPIIALTASATIEDRRACLSAGMDDYLTKPLSMSALRNALVRWGPGRRTPAIESASK